MACPGIAWSLSQSATLPVAAAADGGRYAITSVQILYGHGAEGLPTPASLLDVTVKLADTDGGYVAWRKGMTPVEVKIGNLANLPDLVYYASAVQAIGQAVQSELERQGFTGLTVGVAPDQFDDQGRDLRSSGDQGLKLVVQKPIARAVRADGRPYPITALAVAYAVENPALPAIESILQDATVQLGETEDGYVAWRTGLKPVQVKLADLASLPDFLYYGSAIQSISQALVDALNRQGLVGISVVPGPGQVDGRGKDLRPTGQSAFALIVRPGIVKDVRTVASGSRVEPAEAANHSLHQRISDHSPIGPAAEGQEPQRELLNRDELDRYVAFLNRHPGRRVDVAVAAGPQPGTLALDYLVQESKPWLVYFQVANTGTRQTNEIRERIGFIHNQLTNHDDILSVDYITAGFDKSHAVVVSYDAPFPGYDRLRWRLDGSYSEYTASEIGIFAENFEGRTWSGSGELAWNFYQQRDFFLDAIAGVTYQSIYVSNQLLGTTADEPFVRPHAGLRAQRNRQTDSFRASAMVDMNLDDVAGTEAANVSKLGRADVSTDWTLFLYDLSYSFYLEPLFNGYRTDLELAPMLVHEVALSVRGQQTLDDSRLIPQAEMALGGFYTVRGYPESASVGDNAVVASFEYRYHLPRQFKATENPSSVFGQPFRWAPSTNGALPDWDLVLKAFVDYGYVSSNRPTAFEPDEELLSAGVGAELLIKRYFSLRVDWGFALKDLETRDTAGDSRLHVMGTLYY